MTDTLAALDQLERAEAERGGDGWITYAFTTAALDPLAVLETLEGLDATRVVIAHRLSTVRNADRIVVLERGRIVQAGTFRELAAVPGPVAAMLARQVA